jgi:hypothetical protein
MDSLISFPPSSFTAWPPLSHEFGLTNARLQDQTGNFKGKSTTTKALSIALTTEDAWYIIWSKVIGKVFMSSHYI